MKMHNRIINHHAIHTVQVPIPSQHYANELIKLKCAGDLIDTGVFPNFKEVTESFGAFSATVNHVLRNGYQDLDSDDIAIVCVGDGTTPRTGATFAFRSKFHVFSVDPLLRTDGAWNNVERLTLIPDKIEDAKLELLRVYNRIIIVAVHSHAELRAAVDAVMNATYGYEILDVVAIPCCVQQSLPAVPDVEYEDYGILSPKRTVKIWRNIPF